MAVLARGSAPRRLWRCSIANFTLNLVAGAQWIPAQLPHAESLAFLLARCTGLLAQKTKGQIGTETRKCFIKLKQQQQQQQQHHDF